VTSNQVVYTLLVSLIIWSAYKTLQLATVQLLEFIAKDRVLSSNL
jgi:hypothetical protein